MKILALDTATEACSVAVLNEDKIVSYFQFAERQHTHLLLAMLEKALAAAKLELSQINLLAFARGPGSFTGVRIATAVIQGLSLARNLPVVPVSTMVAIAQQIWRKYQARHVCIALDARMEEVYWGQYQLSAEEIMEPVAKEQLLKPAHINFTGKGESWSAAGSGWDKYREILEKQLPHSLLQIIPACYPEAQDIANIARIHFLQGRYVNASQIEPLYLRNEVVKER